MRQNLGLLPALQPGTPPPWSICEGAEHRAEGGGPASLGRDLRVGLCGCTLRLWHQQASLGGVCACTGERERGEGEKPAISSEQEHT